MLPDSEHLSQQFNDSDVPPRVRLADLAALPCWVAWRRQERNGKATKVPYSPKSGRMAKANDPTTWATRPEALKRAKGMDGTGLMFGPLPIAPEWHLGGIDLDSCLDPQIDLLEPWAREVIKRFDSYAEVSPSGTGVKVLFLHPTADLPALRALMGTDSGRQWKRGTGEHPPSIELHATNRYFAVTDIPVAGCTSDELTVATLADFRWLIDQAGPKFAKSTKTRDESGSGYGYRFFQDQAAQGVTYEQALEAIRADENEAGEWAGRAADRELGRTWANAAAAVERKRTATAAAFDDFEDDPEIARLIGPAKGDGAASLEGFDLSEDGVALAFERRHRHQLRFDHTLGKWFTWDGARWRLEDKRLAFAWARKACRDLAQLEPGNGRAKALARSQAAAGVERFAQAAPCFAVTIDDWDRDSWLLGTPGGTVDLRTGTLRPARQGDMITKSTAVAPIPLAEFNPGRDCPRWLKFLDETTAGDAELIRFLQQWFGYCLTGDTREHALMFIYGPGGNGKSVYLNTKTRILGDYCRTAGMDVFTASKGDRHPQELARLKGARMVCASETEEGRAWAEVRIKQLTGGDTITARFMRQNDFEFRPEFKLTIIGNNKPILNTVDDAARRRFNVVPFDHTPKNPDPKLESKLHAEWPGILSWAIAGCLDWQANGLKRPRVVIEATAEYFAEQDTFQQWLDERCDIGHAHVDTNANLLGDWTCYARTHGEFFSSKSFNTTMQRHGFRPVKNTYGIRGRGYRGVRIRPDEDDFGGLL